MRRRFNYSFHNRTSGSSIKSQVLDLKTLPIFSPLKISVKRFINVWFIHACKLQAAGSLPNFAKSFLVINNYAKDGEPDAALLLLRLYHHPLHA